VHQNESLGPCDPPFITLWNWPQPQKDAASNYSSMSVIDGANGSGTGGGGRGRCGKLTISSQLYWGNNDYYSTFSLNTQLIPPEADTLRMRVNVVRGSVVIAVGSPTIYPAGEPRCCDSCCMFVRPSHEVGGYCYSFIVGTDVIMARALLIHLHATVIIHYK
jgi:hypothetical protein